MLRSIQASLLLLSRNAQHSKQLEDVEEGEHVGRDPGEDGNDADNLKQNPLGDWGSSNPSDYYRLISVATG